MMIYKMEIVANKMKKNMTKIKMKIMKINKEAGSDNLVKKQWSVLVTFKTSV